MYFNGLMLMEATITDADVYNELKICCNGWSDRWSSQRGSYISGVSWLIAYEMKNTTDRNLMTYHYVRHQTNPVYEGPQVFNVLTVVRKLLNLIRPRELNHRKLKEFFSDIQPENENGVADTEALWLSKGNPFKSMHDFKTETAPVLEIKAEHFPQLSESERGCEFVFCTDNSQHLNENTYLHEESHIIN